MVSASKEEYLNRKTFIMKSIGGRIHWYHLVIVAKVTSTYYPFFYFIKLSLILIFDDLTKLYYLKYLRRKMKVL